MRNQSGKVSLIVVLGIPALLGGGAYLYLREHPEHRQLVSARAVEALGAIPSAKLPKPVRGPLQRLRQRLSQDAGLGRIEMSVSAPAIAAKAPAARSIVPDVSPAHPSIPPERAITLYLKNGGVVTGELIRETASELTLRIDGGEVGFSRAELKQLAKGKEGTDDDNVTMPWENEHKAVRWPYQHDVVVKLMKGSVVDAPITRVTPETLILTQRLPSGGEVEHTIARNEIEQLLFKPIRNERSDAIEKNLQTIFPKMHWYEEGMFTIVTDSIPPAVKEYRRTVRELATDWYLTFHPLIQGRTPAVQQYIVIFDDWADYIEYAASDGLPGWLAVGYFSPDDEVLYCFNMLGERFSDLLYDAYLGQFREGRDRVSKMVKGTDYELTVEGQISEFLQKLEQAHSTVRQIYGQISTDVLRHELTHAMFHNWALQGIILSTVVAKVDEEEVKKKRQYLKETDIDKKRQLLEELLSHKKGEPLPEMKAANAWFVEGLAGYMEPSPVGGLNVERLAEAQEAHAKSQILPLEFLNTFKMGSFFGMATQSQLYAYAQSWALCHFLMSRYPEGFLAYQARLAREHPPASEDTLPWLLEAVGHKEQRALEQEFLVYLDHFPKEDPAWLKQMQFFIDLRAELTALATRLWSRYQ